MKTSCRWAQLRLGTASLATLALIVATALLWSTLPWLGATLSADGQSLSIGGLAGWHAELAPLGVALAVWIGLVIASLAVAVAFGLGVATLALAVAALAALAALALVASPMRVAGWLLWRLLGPRPTPRRPA